MTTYASHFETKTRDDGSTFVTLKDDTPRWLKEAVREAHQGTLPNDWIYAECRAAAEAFDDGRLTTDEDDDDVHSHADGRVDVYTKELFQWAADFCLTDTFSAAEEEVDDVGGLDDADTSKRIATIQYAAIRHVADAVKQACRKAAAEADAP
jgi:hypothetical protein